MARIAGVDLPREKRVEIGLTYVYGIGRTSANKILEKTGINPAENNYKDYVFVQTSGNYKGRVITDDGYRKGLKKAAVQVGIEYNIGTHSPRKTFGMISRMLHPNDYDSMELLQTIYNHSDTKTTNHYIGLTKKKIDTYYDDMGSFFDEYVTGDKKYSWRNVLEGEGFEVEVHLQGLGENIKIQEIFVKRALKCLESLNIIN